MDRPASPDPSPWLRTKGKEAGRSFVGFPMSFEVITKRVLRSFASVRRLLISLIHIVLVNVDGWAVSNYIKTPYVSNE